MPIHCPITIAALNADEFEKLDYRVMGNAYASQNELGRLLALTELKAIQWINLNHSKIEFTTI